MRANPVCLRVCWDASRFASPMKLSSSNDKISSSIPLFGFDWDDRSLTLRFGYFFLASKLAMISADSKVLASVIAEPFVLEDGKCAPNPLAFMPCGLRHPKPWPNEDFWILFRIDDLVD